MALNLEAIFRITAKVRDEGLAKFNQGWSSRERRNSEEEFQECN